MSHYPKTGRFPWRDLHTHDEIAALRRVLIERRGFAAKDVLVLEDEQAGAQAIRAAFLNHLIAKAGRGAVVFFHFSGHGQQVKDASGDENDGMDESIVPADSTEQAADYGATHNIIDDEISAWLRQITQKMSDARGRVEGNITLSFDSCYSGTLARGALIERGRAWDSILDGLRPQAGTGATSPTLDLEPRDYVLLGAAHSNQTAKEVVTEQGLGGAYTHALVAALNRLPQQISYRTLLHEVMVEVRSAVSNQTPELEGNLDRLLFGAQSINLPTLTPFLPVIEVRGDGVRIPAGTLHQVTQGSVYALHQPGDVKPGPMTLLAEAEVTTSAMTESWLKLLPAWQGRLPAKVLRSARVVEKLHSYKDTPLRLRTQSVSEELMKALGLSATLQRLVSSGMIVLQPETAQAAGYDLKLAYKPGAIELYRPDSGQPLASVPIRSPRIEAGALRTAGENETLSALLRAEWRWRRLYALRGQSSLLQAELRLVPVEAHRNAAGLVDDTPLPLPGQAGAAIRLPEGALYQLEITNRSPVPVWVTVLELAPDGGIQVLFPDPARPGEGLITTGSGPRLIPHPYVFEATAPRGGYTLKIITTAEQVEFSILAQQAITISPKNALERSSALLSRAAGHPLGGLLVEALTGDLVRSKRTPIELGTWSVDEALLEVVEGVARTPEQKSSPASAPTK